MSPIKPQYRAHQQKRWMRHDSWRFISPDWRRFVKPGSEAAALFEHYERKYRPDQLRDELGRWADEGGGAGGGSPPPATTTKPAVTGEPTAGSGRSDPRVVSDATPDNYYKPGAQIAARISPAQEAKCKIQYEQDIFKCNLIGTASCWSQANFRYSQCLIGGYIPPIYF